MKFPFIGYPLLKLIVCRVFLMVYVIKNLKKFSVGDNTSVIFQRTKLRHREIK